MAVLLILGRVPVPVAVCFGVVLTGVGLAQMYLRARLLGARRNKG
jgi:hypothetical protein